MSNITNGKKRFTVENGILLNYGIYESKSKKRKFS